MLTLALLAVLATPPEQPLVTLVPSPSPGVPARRVAALHKRVLELLSTAKLRANLSASSCDARDCALAAGQKANATVVVAVALAGSTRETAVDLEAMLLSTGKTVSTATFGVKIGAEAGPLDAEATTFVEEVKRALATAAAPPPPDAPLAELKQPVPTLEPAPAPPPEVSEEAVSTAGPSRVPMVVTAVGAGVAAVVAVVFTALAASQQGRVGAVGEGNTSALTWPEAQQLAHSANRNYTIAAVSGGVAAALGATSVVLFATEP